MLVTMFLYLSAPALFAAESPKPAFPKPVTPARLQVDLRKLTAKLSKPRNQIEQERNTEQARSLVVGKFSHVPVKVELRNPTIKWDNDATAVWHYGFPTSRTSGAPFLGLYRPATSPRYRVPVPRDVALSLPRRSRIILSGTIRFVPTDGKSGSLDAKTRRSTYPFAAVRFLRSNLGHYVFDEFTLTVNDDTYKSVPIKE